MAGTVQPKWVTSSSYFWVAKNVRPWRQH